MAYRVEYDGEGIELGTLDAALDCARTAIANDVDRFDGWAVEHDEDVDDWFVQAVRNGRRVGPLAVVTNLGKALVPPVVEEWERRVSFVGRTPADAFAMAADWLERRPDVETIGDVGWHHTASGHQLRIYYRG
ncbi:hypothetical protein GCM10010172_68720 [Paractinoplanes ferrugineus]|uniref:Uncharacterized protein n=1 Tax=Paractinoplanes ferrugineus TaxID=113564 RepID=A0A919MDZ0_9ACTN|nr:hypothetical protein [Actinoplanes ferrugineus]GIE12243.1 hypothetical protein Afe05nite_40830 [Actinoplanes ferrugineus]